MNDTVLPVPPHHRAAVIEETFPGATGGNSHQLTLCQQPRQLHLGEGSTSVTLSGFVEVDTGLLTDLR